MRGAGRWRRLTVGYALRCRSGMTARPLCNGGAMSVPVARHRSGTGATLTLHRERRRMRLSDKVTVITGGGGGMGRIAAHMFAAEGAKVVVAEYSEAAGAETVD